jgi:hypothetical protein
VGLRNYPAAIADCDKTLKIERRRADALYARGIAKRLSHDETGGATDVVAATALEPGIANKMVKLGLSKVE